MAETRLPTISAVEKWRQDKDDHLATSRDSPFYWADEFTGLSYYPEDPAYRVTAKVERAVEPEQVTLATSSGEDKQFVRFGVASFELHGSPLQLTLFTTFDAPEGPRLFVPFQDATSGSETYGAGRYLDLRLDDDGLTIDFNYAYHPYCAYSDGYRCPFPPAENRLSVKVRAGERLTAGA